MVPNFIQKIAQHIREVKYRLGFEYLSKELTCIKTDCYIRKPLQNAIYPSVKTLYGKQNLEYIMCK